MNPETLEPIGQISTHNQGLPSHGGSGLLHTPDAWSEVVFCEIVHGLGALVLPVIHRSNVQVIF